MELLRLGSTTGPVNVTEHCFLLRPLESRAIYTDQAELQLSHLQLLNRLPDWRSEYIAHVTAVIYHRRHKFNKGSNMDQINSGVLDEHQNNAGSNLNANHGVKKGSEGAEGCHYLLHQIAQKTERLSRWVSVNVHAVKRTLCTSWWATSFLWAKSWCQTDDCSMSEQSATISMDDHEESSLNLTNLIQNLAASNRAFFNGLIELPDTAVLDDLAATPTKSETVIFYAGLKELRVVSELDITAADFKLLSPVMIQFQVCSSHVAPYVAIESCLPGLFSDNNFLLKPWHPKTLAFLSDQRLNSTKPFSNCLSFLSLTDTALVLS